MVRNNIFRVALGIAIVASAPLAQANSNGIHDNGVVRNSANRVVVNSFNNCVRTNWEKGYNVCGEVAQVRQVASTESMTTEERTTYFEFDKSRLTPEAKRKLNTLADNLKADMKVREARIVGYADRIGSQSYNDALSKRRANAVKDYLSQRGFINSRVTETRWFGENVPVTQCDNGLPREQLIACLSKDRRVEVEIEYKPVEE